MDRQQLAMELFGRRRAESAAGGSGATTTLYATARGDSSGGTVAVSLPGSQVGGSGSADLSLPCTTSVEAGDRVMVTVVDGHPTVTGVVGRGDAMAASIGAAAQAAADADERARAAQDAAERVREDTDRRISDAESGTSSRIDGMQADIERLRSDAEATYSTKAETDEKTGAITKTLEADYLRSEDAESTYSTKAELRESVDGLSSSVASTYETKDDAASTYSTKTELGQTSDSLSASISQTLADANAHTDGAVADEVAARDAAISASAEGIRTEVAGKYLLKDDAASTYSSKTELTQTEDALKASISQTLSDANAHTDGAVADEATARDAAISASADSIASEVSSTYVRADGTGTDTVTTAVRQNSTSIETMFTTGPGKDVRDAADSAASTADSAKGTADALSTLIREDSTGVSVGKSSDGGKTYEGNRTHMSASDFSVMSSDGTVLSRFGENLIELGKNSQSAVIELCDGLGRIKEEVISRLHALALEGESIALYGTRAAFMTVMTKGVEQSGVWCQDSNLGLNGRNGVTVNTPTWEVLGPSHVTFSGASDGGAAVDVSQLATVTVKSTDDVSITCDGAQVCRALAGEIGSHTHTMSQISDMKVVNVYCAYNPNGGEHYFTASASEYNNLVKAGWTAQGVAFRALG